MKSVFNLKYKRLSFLLPSNGVKQALCHFFKENPQLNITELYYSELGPKTAILFYWEMPEAIDGVRMRRMEATFSYDRQKEQLTRLERKEARDDVAFRPLLDYVQKRRSHYEYLWFRLKNIVSPRPRI